MNNLFYCPYRQSTLLQQGYERVIEIATNSSDLILASSPVAVTNAAGLLWAFRCKADRFANLTIKKIPKMVLNRCEWVHNDYCLNVQILPAERDPEQQCLLGDADD
ncbi:MAG: hypothetical protein RQ899_02225 [Pseudomonadales bacterium]|nr:hypothetical protein [Pseudomonadales bacterium]